MKLLASFLPLLFGLYAGPLSAQNCSSADIELTTQEQVDSFQQDYGPCTTVTRNLSIGVYGSDSFISDLDGLSELTRVEGSLAITKQNLAMDSEGLRNITFVGTQLYAGYNPGLTNIDGYRGVTSVGTDIWIFQNPNLTDLDGIANVETVGRDVQIRGELISDLNALQGISISGDLDLADLPLVNSLSPLSGSPIGGLILTGSNFDDLSALAHLTHLDNLSLNNTGLTSLSGLENVRSLGTEEEGAYLSISYNDDLLSTDSFSPETVSLRGVFIGLNPQLSSISSFSVTSPEIAGDVSILSNPQLISLDFFQGLERIGSYIQIIDNQQLSDISGLMTLEEVSDRFWLGTNPNLTECWPLAKLLGWPNGPPQDGVAGSINIGSEWGYANAEGCNSVAEILDGIVGPSAPVIQSVQADGYDATILFSESVTPDIPVADYSAVCDGESAARESVVNQQIPDDNTLAVDTISFGDVDAWQTSIELRLDLQTERPRHMEIALVSPSGTRAMLWDRSSASNLDISGTFPTDYSPADPFTVFDGESFSGDWSLELRDAISGYEARLVSWRLKFSERTSTASATSPVRLGSFRSGQSYDCSVAPNTVVGLFPASNLYSYLHPYAPSNVVVSRVEAGDAELQIFVTVDSGGASVINLVATCTDGANTFTGASTSSPITVSGLTNDVAYTCTVTATNSVGTSSASAATDPITPEETATGLPIWLLYQATQ